MEISQLEPRAVFRFFEEISRIPRPSYQERAISDYLAAFAGKRGLFCRQDALGNIIIVKDASPGYEEEPPIILQGHMDMVCEKEPDCAKDMETEGLDLFVEGDFVKARGTTLGGDDGIAVAYAGNSGRGGHSPPEAGICLHGVRGGGHGRGHSPGCFLPEGTAASESGLRGGGKLSGGLRRRMHSADHIAAGKYTGGGERNRREQWRRR